MMNPYKEARLQKNLSLRRLSDISGITPLAILRLEQGLFSEPLSRLNKYLDLPTQQTTLRYYEFQKSQRQSQFPLPPVVSSTGGSLGFVAWRRKNWPSQANFCTSLCVSQSTINRYEANWQPGGRGAIFPIQLREALLDAGLSEREIESLSSAGELKDAA